MLEVPFGESLKLSWVGGTGIVAAGILRIDQNRNSQITALGICRKLGQQKQAAQNERGFYSQSHSNSFAIPHTLKSRVRLIENATDI